MKLTRWIAPFSVVLLFGVADAQTDQTVAAPPAGQAAAQPPQATPPPPPQQAAPTAQPAPQGYQQQGNQPQPAEQGENEMNHEGWQQRERREAALPSGTIRSNALNALTDIDAANDALTRNDPQEAERRVGEATDLLEHLYDHVPAAWFATRLEVARQKIASDLAANPKDRTAAVDLEPIRMGLDSHGDSLAPEVSKPMEEALRAQHDGDSHKALKLLTESEQRLAWDTSLVQVDGAYLHALGAQESLRCGKTDRARRMLIDAHEAVVQTALRAPLVPIKMDLRAAASAIDNGNESRATVLAQHASDQLRSLSRSIMPANKALQSLTSETDRVEQDLASGKSVNPNELREIAQRTDEIIPHGQHG